MLSYQTRNVCCPRLNSYTTQGEQKKSHLHFYFRSRARQSHTPSICMCIDILASYQGRSSRGRKAATLTKPRGRIFPYRQFLSFTGRARDLSGHWPDSDWLRVRLSPCCCQCPDCVRLSLSTLGCLASPQVPVIDFCLFNTGGKKKGKLVIPSILH